MLTLALLCELGVAEGARGVQAGAPVESGEPRDGAPRVTTEIHALPEDAAVHYSMVLATVAKALPTSVAVAEQLLEPIAGEVWMGSLTLHGKTAPGAPERSSRAVPDRIRAQVFLRDGFICSYCGGPTIPRCVLVAISDVFPEAFPYYAHYRRGTVHPAYWALVPEADHTLAHANGGSSGIENLTTMHAMCNTRKSSLATDGLPAMLRPAPDDARWDGLLRTTPTSSSPRTPAAAGTG